MMHKVICVELGLGTLAVLRNLLDVFALNDLNKIL
jgi:hypothetical protein